MRPITEDFTIAIVGHDEEATLGGALTAANAVADERHKVLFVDSASTDRSRSVADRSGVEVLDAPLGEGRAVAKALAQCTTTYLCLVDADIEYATKNIPDVMCKTVDSRRPDLLVGDFNTGKQVSILSNTVGVYKPLVAAIFPESVDRFGSKPLTGFRVLRSDFDWGALPPDFGVEAYLNLVASASGARTSVVDIGEYHGPFKYKPRMGAEIGRAILDLAENTGRIDHECRAAWDSWVEDVVEHVGSYHGDESGRTEYVNVLLELAARPTPPLRLEAQR